MQQWKSGLCWLNIYYSSTIHKEGKRRGNEHKSFHFFLFISLLGRQKFPHRSREDTRNHTRPSPWSRHQDSGSISTLTCKANPLRSWSCFLLFLRRSKDDWILSIQTGRWRWWLNILIQDSCCSWCLWDSSYLSPYYVLTKHLFWILFQSHSWGIVPPSFVVS